MISKKRLLFIQLNEINFDLVSKYIEKFPDSFHNFRKILSGPKIITKSEDDYENLEPWIQWVSVNTGKEFNQHNIFRLGDITVSSNEQIYEKIESLGYKVGAISPMNTENRLKNGSYFIPDPWTLTNSDKSIWSKLIHKTISQTVNDNSEAKISLLSALVLLCGLIKFAQFKHYKTYIKLAFTSFGAPWRKALFLDLFLNDVHYAFYRKKDTDFSTIFLNAGAHIQHHYLLNSQILKKSFSNRNPSWYLKETIDPFEEMLEVYDSIIKDILSTKNTEILIATGLSKAL